MENVCKTCQLWLLDVVGRFTQRGWLETEAEILFSKDNREGLWPNNLIDNQPSLQGWFVVFRYFVNERPYDGVLVSRDELKKGEKFTIRYNPAHPDQNNSLETKLEWMSDTALWTYFYLLAALIVASALAGAFFLR